jgi:hypothetical protein
VNTEQELRAALRTRSESVDPTPMSGRDLRGAARTQRHHRLQVGLVVSAAVLAVAAVAFVVPAALTRVSLPPASTQVDGWPTRGDLAGDGALQAAALRAWEAAPVLKAELPHRDVRIVLASRTPFGRYVMLSGLNALGHRRLAIFSDDPRDHELYASRLRLRSDLAFPEGELVTYWTSRQEADVERHLLLAAGPPDVTRMSYGSGSGDWQSVASPDGVVAEVIRAIPVGTSLRAYRDDRRVAEVEIEPFLGGGLYEPDAALVRNAPPLDEQCSADGCSVSAGGGVVVATPDNPNALSGVERPQGRSWEDMADQADQLFRNHAAPARQITQWSGGPVLSGLLPDGVGVHLSTAAINEGPTHHVLYLDRPEWPVGRLYLARAYPPDEEVTVLSAVLGGVGEKSARLVVLAADGVSVRYRVSAGRWAAVIIDAGLGSVALPRGSAEADVELEITQGGNSRVVPPDALAPLPAA